MLIVRKDLEMPAGKIAAQVGHAVQLRILGEFETSFENDEIRTSTTPEMISWLKGIYTKLVLGIDSLEKLLSLEKKASELGIPTVLVRDKGLTCFEGEETITVLALGPVLKEVHHPLTKRLRLLD
ncbi:MAG TPA: aminoacyl-tRNA hydrolase [Oligoflexia bacterium]|nr:aminoacyl-tRNA hydrolase [Oligoflexia bacterium]HMP49906.1 aminoacyl-tRNA hydrolase [Oligoflexia bacterium]